jgi:hypothetical protein
MAEFLVYPRSSRLGFASHRAWPRRVENDCRGKCACRRKCACQGKNACRQENSASYCRQDCRAFIKALGYRLVPKPVQLGKLKNVLLALHPVILSCPTHGREARHGAAAAHSRRFYLTERVLEAVRLIELLPKLAQSGEQQPRGAAQQLFRASPPRGRALAATWEHRRSTCGSQTARPLVHGGYEAPDEPLCPPSSMIRCHVYFLSCTHVSHTPSPPSAPVA